MQTPNEQMKMVSLEEIYLEALLVVTEVNKFKNKNKSGMWS